MRARRVMRIGSGLATLVVVGAALATAPSAWAAAPTNDNRADALELAPPQSVTGTLVEATLETVNDTSNCGSTDSSVWYRFTGPPRGDIVVQLDAAGEMDATMDLYKVVRSKLSWAGCDSTDDQGSLTFDRGGLEAGAEYAIRVGNQTGSAADSFKLRVLVPTPPPSPPGRRLPAGGVTNHVDRVLNPGDAYWKRMRAGFTMRLSLRTQHCTSLQVYGPGTTSFADTAPERTLPCGGFGLYTPTTSGRHFLVVRAARDRDRQDYTLRAARAGRDDTAPGILIHNHASVTASVNGGLDTRDLYRFDVRHRSALTLRLAGDPSMTLVNADGARLGFGNQISRHVPAGRYFVAVSGNGRYTLRYAAKTITRAHLLVNHRHAVTIAPGRTAHWQLRVTPAVGGPSVITVERFDPIEGWQFLRTFRRLVTDGSARVAFTPPSVGRYRASASYLGSRNAAPASTGLAWLTVQGPLAQ